MSFPLLSTIILAPLLGVVVLLFIPKEKEGLIKSLGILATIPSLILTFTAYIKSQQGIDVSTWAEKQTWFRLGSEEQYGKYMFSINYEVGVNGFSLLLLVLTAFIATMAAIASLRIEKEWKGYFQLFLLLELGMLGVFAAENMILFFLFFEITLVTAFFLIGKWGYAFKEKAAYSFLIYNGLGSAILLIVITILFAKTGTVQFGLLGQVLQDEATFDLVKMTPALRMGLLIPILIAFGIKLPIFPFHTWMVHVHTQAPPPVVMIHSGILLKIGAYGLIRFGMEIFPKEFASIGVVIIILGLINLLYGAFLALIQDDLKKVLAYSSVSHMGIVLIGLGALNMEGLQGAMFQVISHGLISSLFFFLVGVLYARTGTTNISELGGLVKSVPVVAGLLLTTGLASLGIPGMSGFISEFTAFVGIFKSHPTAGYIGLLGLILTAVYVLRAVLGITYGEPKRKQEWGDLKPIEWVPSGLLVISIIAIGVFPAILTEPLFTSLQAIMVRIGG
ncbi:NADH dehydrogenase subunit M [Bacillus oleivorans]|uniref:NADH dehydrogenase subunit M n=1 Tax=Bacillus oleivorans TaxID=1448271 RepID=A0A285CHC5_9BACI|nr:NADH-quinone oxidoreductase subunit M [Bacillus oleivorans]SNX66994.1 NADH dehydrogenase subunit M [Bacillus oleivorans]